MHVAFVCVMGSAFMEFRISVGKSDFADIRKENTYYVDKTEILYEFIFTGTNNFASYSVLDRQFSSYFGFTKEEVDKLLEAADRTEKADVIKEWYDGQVICYGVAFFQKQVKVKLLEK